MSILDKIVDEKMYYEFGINHPQSINRFLERAKEDLAKAQSAIRGLEKAKEKIESVKE
jgi:hypothetical protein